MKKKFSISEKKCRICFSKNIINFLNLGKQPLANNLKKGSNSLEKKIPLKLFFCKKCKTVQLSETVDPGLLFSNYFWKTSTSNAAKNFSNKFCENILSRTKFKKGLVLEIASNDGTFLKPFKKKGFKVIGVDPAKNINKFINKKIKIYESFFNISTSELILSEQGNAKIIFARNVIAHVNNIHQIIEGAKNLLSEDGIMAVEFHYAKEILDGLQYDSIYHEHLFYFTIKTLATLFEKKGLYLFDAFKSPISGGAMVALFKKKKTLLSKAAKDFLIIEKRKKINSYLTWKSFSKRAKIHSYNLVKLLNNYKDKKIIAYGASARSSTLLNFSKINYRQIPEIIDKNTLKHGKFTPGSKIKIIDFKTGIKKIRIKDIVLLLAWNFSKEIINSLKTNKIRCKIIQPLPKKIKVYEI